MNVEQDRNMAMSLATRGHGDAEHKFKCSNMGCNLTSPYSMQSCLRFTCPGQINVPIRFEDDK